MICIKSSLVITILAFSIHIPAPTVLPFLEAPLVALFWYDWAACCHILLNFLYTHKTMGFEPNLKSKVQPVGDVWNWGLHQQLLHCEGGITKCSVMMQNTTVSSFFWPFQNALNQCVRDENFVYLFNNRTLIWFHEYTNLDYIFTVPSQCRPAAALIFYSFWTVKIICTSCWQQNCLTASSSKTILISLIWKRTWCSPTAQNETLVAHFPSLHGQLQHTSFSICSNLPHR